MPRVSVIIPAYNPGRLLHDAVTSVLAQTWQDWECVVVDDGSKEDLGWLDGIDSRVSRVRQPNRGLPIARNAGILESQGQYLAFLDADDLWLPTKLHEQLRLMDADSEVAFCHTGFDIIDDNGTHQGVGFARPVESYIGLLRDSCVCVSTCMVRRSCLHVSGMFDPLRRACEDYDMWLKLARYYKIAFIPTCQAHYRVHSSNMSGNPSLMASEVTDLLRRHHRFAKASGDKMAAAAAASSIRGARLGWGCAAFDHSRQSLHKRDFRGFRSNLIISLRLAPLYTVRTMLRSAICAGRDRTQR